MLRELQLQMMEALYNGRYQSVIGLVDAPAPEAAGRINVYRNTSRNNFIEALIGTYPVIYRLVGGPYFRQVANTFRISNESTSGDLQQCGERFAQLLSDLHSADDFCYLSDVARLEWLIQEALLAADSPSLNLADLARVDSDERAHLTFQLHPSLRLFMSAYPVLKIWQTNENTHDEPELIDLRSGADRLIVIRQAAKLQFHRLSAGEYEFLCAIFRKEEFLSAVEAASSSDSVFDAGAALQRLVRINAIVNFEVRPDSWCAAEQESVS